MSEVNRYRCKSRLLRNCFDAYLQFPFEQRFECFKSVKKYFLEDRTNKEVDRIYREFVFFHFVTYHGLYPQFTKEEILLYFHERKNEFELKNKIA